MKTAIYTFRGLLEKEKKTTTVKILLQGHLSDVPLNGADR